MVMRVWNILAVVVLGLGLAACAAPKDEFGQCEEGVAELSAAATLVPGNC